MRFTTAGVALMGTTQISVNGVVPATLVAVNAGNPQPYTSNLAIFQNSTLGNVLQFLNLTTSVLTSADADGQNALAAGGSVWAAYLASTPGVRTNVVGLGPFPLGSIGDVSEDGHFVLVKSQDSATGLASYSSAGVLKYQNTAALQGFAEVRARQGYFAYEDAAGWWVRSLETGTAQSVAQRADVLLTIPIVISSRVYLVEYVSAVGVSVRLATGSTGYVIPATTTNGFNIDAVYLSGTTVRVGMSSGAGEAPTELRVFDVNVQTGALSAGVTTTGALVFTTQPAVPTGSLPTSGTTGGSSASRLPPGLYQHPITDLKTGKITPPWNTALTNAFGDALGPIDLSTTSDFSGVLQPENGGTGTTTGLNDILPGALEFSDESLLLGRGEGNGGGDGQEISLGTGLVMTGTVLSTNGAGTWIPLVDGSEPPVFLTDGLGNLLLVAYTP